MVTTVTGLVTCLIAVRARSTHFLLSIQSSHGTGTVHTAHIQGGFSHLILPNLDTHSRHGQSFFFPS